MSALIQLYEIGGYVDTYAPGFSARVARATHWPSGRDVAFKVLRREHLNDAWVWNQFAVEADLLLRLRHSPVIAQMADCGYVSDDAHDVPAEGEIASHGEKIDSFRSQMALRYGQGWRPYVALELLPEEHCLLNLVRGADGDGVRPFRLPMEEGVDLAMQFVDFLRATHALDVVYWDHKPEHVYWDGRRLRLIDLNVSRLLSADLSVEARAFEKRKDLRHLAAGVLYTVFTGRDFRFQGTPPQAEPSDPLSVDRRFKGPAHLAFGVDDAILPELCDLLQECAGPGSDDPTANSVLDRLRQIAAQIGWELGYPVADAACKARREIQQALATLRHAQAGIKKARQHLLVARSLNPADPDTERLSREADEFYLHRVLP